MRINDWQTEIKRLLETEAQPITDMQDPRVQVILRDGLAPERRQFVTPGDLERMIETDAEDLGLVYFRHHVEKSLPEHVAPAWASETVNLWAIYNPEPALIISDRSTVIGADGLTVQLERDTYHLIETSEIQAGPISMVLTSGRDVIDISVSGDRLQLLSASIEQLARLLDNSEVGDE